MEISCNDKSIEAGRDCQKIKYEVVLNCYRFSILLTESLQGRKLLTQTYKLVQIIREKLANLSMKHDVDMLSYILLHLHMYILLFYA